MGCSGGPVYILIVWYWFVTIWQEFTLHWVVNDHPHNSDTGRGWISPKPQQTKMTASISYQKIKVDWYVLMGFGRKKTTFLCNASSCVWQEFILSDVLNGIKSILAGGLWLCSNSVSGSSSLRVKAKGMYIFMGLWQEEAPQLFVWCRLQGVWQESVLHCVVNGWKKKGDWGSSKQLETSVSINSSLNNERLFWQEEVPLLFVRCHLLGVWQ